jgi:hypothetical protein
MHPDFQQSNFLQTHTKEIRSKLPVRGPQELQPYQLAALQKLQPSQLAALQARRLQEANTPQLSVSKIKKPKTFS